MRKPLESLDRESLLAALARANARETATREILNVVNQSREDQHPVFDVVLRNSRRLCDACKAALLLGRPGDASDAGSAQ